MGIALVILAAFLNACMDVQKHRWHKSVFRSFKNPRLRKFYHIYSWKNVYVNWDQDNKTKRKLLHPALVDAWHFNKSLMICLLLGTFAISTPTSYIFSEPIYILDYIIYGIAWNATFNTFYNHILIYKNKYLK
jgi:hypothetical protein